MYGYLIGSKSQLFRVRYFYYELYSSSANDQTLNSLHQVIRVQSYMTSFLLDKVFPRVTVFPWLYYFDCGRIEINNKADNAKTRNGN